MDLKDLYDMLFSKSGSVKLTDEQRAEIEKIEADAYIIKAKELAKTKGTALAQRKYDEMMKK